MDCRYCHSFVDRSSHSNVPTSETCMNCHQHVEEVRLPPSTSRPDRRYSRRTHRKGFSAVILARLIPAFVLLTGVPAGAQGLIDYDTLTHTIQVNTIRAGIHDESGENNYYFKVDMFGLVLTKEERKMEFAKRK